MLLVKRSRIASMARRMIKPSDCMAILLILSIILLMFFTGCVKVDVITGAEKHEKDSKGVIIIDKEDKAK